MAMLQQLLTCDGCIHRMLEAAEALPLNIGFTGKGQAVNPTALVEQIHAGVIGLKVHEDWGATPSALHHALTCMSYSSATLSAWCKAEGVAPQSSWTFKPITPA